MSYHHGNLKEALLQAGDEELKTHGIATLSLREIAKRAGVSHNAPYRHFSDKVDLIDQIIEKQLLEISEQILAAPLIYPASVFLQIQYVGRIWAHLATRHPRKAHLIFTGLSQSESRQSVIQASHRLILQNLAQVLEGARGLELNNQFDSSLLALQLIASFRGLGILYTSKATDDFMQHEDDFFNLCDLAAENILLSAQA
jgi:AcrR family transcriptional regulator